MNVREKVTYGKIAAAKIELSLSVMFMSMKVVWNLFSFCPHLLTLSTLPFSIALLLWLPKDIFRFLSPCSLISSPPSLLLSLTSDVRVCPFCLPSKTHNISKLKWPWEILRSSSCV